MKWLDTEEQRLNLRQHDDHKLFIGSLPRKASEESLYELFSILGEIESIRFEDTQFWAFIDYKNKESALLAIKYFNGHFYRRKFKKCVKTFKVTWKKPQN